MKKYISFIVLASAIALLSSCSKTLVLSDGTNTKTIKVLGKVKVVTDEQNQQYANFESVRGTKYHIDLHKYNCTVDNLTINTNVVSMEPEK
jgi:hypothetical protein